MASIISSIATSVTSRMIGTVVTDSTQSDCCGRETMKNRLDPIGFLAMIALMKYQLIDTKIHIGNYSVTSSHSSDYTFGWNFRCLSRTFSGDSHEDLALIRPAVKTAAYWHSLHLEENIEIREFMSHVIEGIKALIETYQNKYPTTCDALEFYTLRIQDYKTEAPDNFEELNEVTGKIKALWPKAEIGELNTHLRKMTKIQGSTPISTKILCKSEVTVYTARVQAKSEEIKRIFTQ